MTAAILAADEAMYPNMYTYVSACADMHPSQLLRLLKYHVGLCQVKGCHLGKQPSATSCSYPTLVNTEARAVSLL